MTKFETKTLKNGLTVIANEDRNTPYAQINVVYDVGSKDEKPTKTGFAHLFEHLMFEGSKNVKKVDEEIERAGGSLNAWTSQDFTNYHEYLPAENLETAFWVESDRMHLLNINEKALKQEQSIVIEEFKQTQINKPYGDVWKIISESSFKKHPYRWVTIGKSLKHIQKFELQDVKDFYKKFYAPNNAVVSVSGNIKTETVFELAEKWFGDLKSNKLKKRSLPIEEKRKEKNFVEVYRDVPQTQIYITFLGSRKADLIHYTDRMIAEILSQGESSRLHQELVKEKRIATNAYFGYSGQVDNGLLYFGAGMVDGVKPEVVEKAIWEEIKKVKSGEITLRELEKARNNMLVGMESYKLSIHNKAFSLAESYLIGDPNRINLAQDRILNVTLEDIVQRAKDVFKEKESTVIYYHAKK